MNAVRRLLEVVAAILGSSLVWGLVANEVGELCEWLAGRLIRWAVRTMVAPEVRTDLEEELLANLDSKPGKVLKLGFAVGLVAWMPFISRALREQAPPRVVAWRSVRFGRSAVGFASLVGRLGQSWAGNGTSQWRWFQGAVVGAVASIVGFVGWLLHPPHSAAIDWFPPIVIAVASLLAGGACMRAAGRRTQPSGQLGGAGVRAWRWAWGLLGASAFASAIPLLFVFYIGDRPIPDSLFSVLTAMDRLSATLTAILAVAALLTIPIGPVRFADRLRSVRYGLLAGALVAAGWITWVFTIFPGTVVLPGQQEPIDMILPALVIERVSDVLQLLSPATGAMTATTAISILIRAHRQAITRAGMGHLLTITLAMVSLAVAASSWFSLNLVENWTVMSISRAADLAGYLMLMLAALRPTGGDDQAVSPRALTPISQPSPPLS